MACKKTDRDRHIFSTNDANGNEIIIEILNKDNIIIKVNDSSIEISRDNIKVMTMNIISWLWSSDK